MSDQDCPAWDRDCPAWDREYLVSDQDCPAWGRGYPVLDQDCPVLDQDCPALGQGSLDQAVSSGLADLFRDLFRDFRHRVQEDRANRAQDHTNAPHGLNSKLFRSSSKLCYYSRNRSVLPHELYNKCHDSDHKSHNCSRPGKNVHHHAPDTTLHRNADIY